MILLLSGGQFISHAQVIGNNSENTSDQKQQKIKDKQKREMNKKQEDDKKKHLQHQSKEVQKRMKKNLRETNMGYRKKRWHNFFHDLFKKLKNFEEKVLKF